MRGGLLQPPEQATQGQPGMGGEAVDGEGEASPQEQQLYDALMVAAMELIHSAKTRKSVAKRLKGSAENDLHRVIGMTALDIFNMVEGQAEQKGVQIPDSVRMELGLDLITELVDVAVAMNLVPDEEEAIGVVIAGAIDTMASKYGNQRKQQGKIDPNQAQAMLRELAPRVQQTFGGVGGGQQPMAGAVQDASRQM